MDLVNALVVLANFVIVPGIAYGSQLALGALGVTLVYGILRFSNFAHGDTMAFGAMVTVLVTWWLQSTGLSISPLPTALLALPPAIVACSAMVVVCDRLVYRGFRRKRSAPVTFVIASVGVMFVLNGLVRFIIGPDDQRFSDGARFIQFTEAFAHIGHHRMITIESVGGHRHDQVIGAKSIMARALDGAKDIADAADAE